MCAAPQSATIEVIEHLMFEASKRPLYPLEIMKLRKAAQAIMDDNPATAHSAYGVIACLQGDEKMMRHEHELSISLMPWSANMNANYARSLNEHEYVAEAIPFQVRAVELAPEDITHLDTLLRLAYHADADDVLERWLPEYRKRTGHGHEAEAWLVEDEEDLRAIEEAENDPEPTIPWDKLKAELGF